MQTKHAHHPLSLHPYLHNKPCLPPPTRLPCSGTAAGNTSLIRMFGCCRGNGNAETDKDMLEASPLKDTKLKKEKKDKKDKKEKKEKKKHKKDKKDKRAADKDGGGSDTEAVDKKQIEDELRQKALLSARKSDSFND